MELYSSYLMNHRGKEYGTITYWHENLMLQYWWDGTLYMIRPQGNRGMYVNKAYRMGRLGRLTEGQVKFARMNATTNQSDPQWYLKDGLRLPRLAINWVKFWEAKPL